MCRCLLYLATDSPKILLSVKVICLSARVLLGKMVRKHCAAQLVERSNDKKQAAVVANHPYSSLQPPNFIHMFPMRVFIIDPAGTRKKNDSLKISSSAGPDIKK